MSTARIRRSRLATTPLVLALSAIPAAAQSVFWTSHGPTASVAAIALDPNDASILYAAGSHAGIFRSDDAGASWRALETGGPLGGFTCLAVDPVDPSNIYAGTGGGGVSASHDGGGNWTRSQVGSGLPVTALVVEGGGRSVYAAIGGAGGFGSQTFDRPLQRSTDGGRSWSHANLSSPRAAYALLADSLGQVLFAGTDYSYSQGYYGLGDYPRGGGVLSSPDAGSSWSLAPTNLGSAVTALAGDSEDGPLLAATAQGKVYRSLDHGSSWRLLSALPGSVTALARDATRPGTVYAGLRELGVWRSTDSGTSWRAFDSGLTNLSVRSLVVDPTGRRLHVATAGGGVFDRQLPSPSTDPCSPGDDHLCLLGGRFRIDVSAADRQSGAPAPAAAKPQGDRFGYFSFPTLTGDGSLPEVFVKMVDATALPGEGHWVFYGGLTDVRYTLTVNDTATGRTQYYDSESLCGGADTRGFPPVHSPSAASSRAPAASPVVLSGSELDLLSSRFRITLLALNPRTGALASGAALAGGDRFGYFSLPEFTGDSTFPEVFVKMIDATSLSNGDFWLFHLGLTSLPYRLTVTDTVTGVVKTYRNNPTETTRLFGGFDPSVVHSAIPIDATGTWIGTSVPSCAAASTANPFVSASVTQTGDRLRLQVNASTCFYTERFDGWIDGGALHGALSLDDDGCRWEAPATGTISGSEIHLTAPQPAGTCGFLGIGPISLDLKPPAS